MTLHVCAPDSFKWADDRRCRRCRRDTRHVVVSFVWYGPMTTCCECGAFVNDGELRRKRVGDTKTALNATAEWSTLPRRSEMGRWLQLEFRKEATFS